MASAIGRLVNAALAADIRREVTQPWQEARLPDRREHHVGVLRIDREIDCAGVLADEQGFRPGLAAVFRTEYATLGVRTEHVSECRDHHDVGVVRIDPDRADMARRFKADRMPARTAVDGFEHALARRHVVARGHLAGTRVQHARIGCCDGQRADRRRTMIEDRVPRAPGIEGLPDAAAGRAEVERVRLVGDADRDRTPAAAKRPDQAPAHSVGKCGGCIARRRGGLLCGCRERGDDRGSKQA